MNKWIKENWFKLGILIMLIVLAGSVALYLNDKNKIAEQVRLDGITRESAITIEKEKTEAGQEQALLLEQQKKEEEKQLARQSLAEKNDRIASQIIEFEDVLEGKLVDAGTNCIVIATYNNLEIVDPSLLPQALPDSKETYRQRCLSSYVPLNLLRNKLVAEPETQNLRRILTSYIDSVRSLALYVLDGGYSAQVIDKHSAEFDTFRLEAREELLRLQRQYNVNPQYK